MAGVGSSPSPGGAPPAGVQEDEDGDDEDDDDDEEEEEEEEEVRAWGISGGLTILCSHVAGHYHISGDLCMVWAVLCACGSFVEKQFGCS